MNRVDFARWLLLFALCGTVISTLAGSTIGVLIGTTYIVIAITATLVDLIEKGGRHGSLDGKDRTVNRNDSTLL